MRGQVATFPIDHILPKTLGGSKEIDHLALTCPWCNSRKWCGTQGADPETGEENVFFNPRQEEWFEHFQWDADSIGELRGVTPTGRATVIGLKLNDPVFVALRSVLFSRGLFPEIGG